MDNSNFANFIVMVYMKVTRLIVGFSLVFILFSSCQETPPFINYEDPQYLTGDTTYVLDQVPAPQPKNVLIEDVSGVRCPNCPEANELAQAIHESNPNRVVVMTIHPTSLKNLTFPITDTFNTEDGERIFQDLIGGSPQGGLPIGAINRKLFAPEETSVAISDKKWQKYATDEMALMARINLDAEIVQVEGRTVTVRIRATFTDTMANPVFLTVGLTESYIISPQESTTGRIEEYEHNHVLRDIVTPYQGDRIVEQVNQKGFVFERVMTFEISDKYDERYCSIIVLLSRLEANNKEVLQVTELDWL